MIYEYCGQPEYGANVGCVARLLMIGYIHKFSRELKIGLRFCCNVSCTWAQQCAFSSHGKTGISFFRWVVARIESGPGCIMLAWDDTTSESRVFWKGWAGAPTAAPNFPLYFLLFFCFWEGFSWKLASASIALLNAENWKASISICRRNFWYEINDDIMRDRPV